MQKAQNQSKVGCPQSPRIRIFPWSDFEEHDGRCRNGEKPKDDYVPPRPPALKSRVSELQDGADANKRVTTLSFELITSRSQLLQDDFLRCQRKRQHRWTVTIVVGRTKSVLIICEDGNPDKLTLIFSRARPLVFTRSSGFYSWMTFCSSWQDWPKFWLH